MQFVFSTAAIVIGVLLDLIIGDPEGIPHPVRWLGELIEEIEGRLRGYVADNPQEKKRGGLILWVIVVVVSILVPAVILFVAWKLSPHLYLILATVLCYYIMATKSLRDESMQVKKMLDIDDIYLARIRLSRIVGRDTEGLDEKQIMRATVETVAENTSDGCVAPLFYMALFGPVGGFVYKAINTMDSMLGYKNEKYIDFGYMAAKADDVANFIPSRLSALLMIAASFLTRMDYEGATEVWKRDRLKSESPNSAQTESVCAGALGVELLGDASYGGVTYKREIVGDEMKIIDSGDIEKANDLLYVTVILMVVLVIIWRVICALILGLIG